MCLAARPDVVHSSWLVALCEGFECQLLCELLVEVNNTEMLLLSVHSLTSSTLSKCLAAVLRLLVRKAVIRILATVYNTAALLQSG